MPRDVSLSDSKCWNGGQKLVNKKIISGGAAQGSAPLLLLAPPLLSAGPVLPLPRQVQDQQSVRAPRNFVQVRCFSTFAHTEKTMFSVH